MSVDAALNLAFTLLRDSTSMPAGMAANRLRLQELLPSDTEELPLVAVYLVEDRPILDAPSGMSNREAVVQVETRVSIPAGQNPVSATAPYRTWICRTLLPNVQLETGIEDTTYGGYRPFGVAGVDRLAGAVQEFVIPFFFDPQEA